MLRSSANCDADDDAAAAGGAEDEAADVAGGPRLGTSWLTGFELISYNT